MNKKLSEVSNKILLPFCVMDLMVFYSAFKYNVLVLQLGLTIRLGIDTVSRLGIKLIFNGTPCNLLHFISEIKS